MRKAQPKADNRTLVDRLLDRIKNNRVAALVIIASLGLGAIASLTDSAKKLSGALSSFSSVSVAGEWKSDAAEFYPIGMEYMRLHLQETAGQVLGSVRFSGTQDARARTFGIFDGKREGKNLTLSFDSGAILLRGSGGQPVPLRETISGELVGSDLHLVYQREGQGAVAGDGPGPGAGLDVHPGAAVPALDGRAPGDPL